MWRKCCKTLPAGTIPSQFGSIDQLKDNLIIAINSKKWAIDCWEGDLPGYDQVYNQVFYIRPAIVGREPLDRSYQSGNCVNLTPIGCSLSYDQRPYGCQAFIPKFEHGKTSCYFSWGETYQSDKHMSCVAWRPHQDIIVAMMNELEIENRELTIIDALHMLSGR